MFYIRKAKERGITKTSWLDSKHTFSFGSYHDPEHTHFGFLRVINDDIVEASTGFGGHPHKNMEILTYVLKGAVAHKDSMGNGSTINAGEIQIMSAGSGVTHSEMNPSTKDPFHLLQIWFFPKSKNTQPAYGQKPVAETEKRGKLCLIVSPNGENNSLLINQDIHVFAGLFTGQETHTHTLQQNHVAWVHVAKGAITINDTQLNAGDGVGITDTQSINISGGKDAEILVFDMDLTNVI